MVNKMNEAKLPKDVKIELEDLIDQMTAINGKLSRIQSKYFSDEGDYDVSVWVADCDSDNTLDYIADATGYDKDEIWIEEMY